MESGGGGGGGRRRRLLSDEKVDSANLRDFLRVKQDDDGRNLSGVTLSAMLDSEKRSTPSQVNRTLLDIIRDDPYGGTDNKKSWKVFRDKLRLRRAAAAWTSTVPTPASDVSIQNRNRMISRRNSTRSPTSVVNSEVPTSESNHPELSSSSTSINRGENRNDLNSMASNRAMMLGRSLNRVSSMSTNSYCREVEGSTSYGTSRNNAGDATELRRQVPSAERVEDEDEETEEGVGETEDSAEGGEPPVRMSLMALLAETDRQMGLDGSAFTMDDEEEEEEEEVEEEEQKEEEVASGGVEYNCCVCMLRHKGSAFIPCGHTFCRLCSRELWVQRGNCPLCNGFILEILDIF